MDIITSKKFYDYVKTKYSVAHNSIITNEEVEDFMETVDE
jgi:hypothetical protein